MSIPVLDRLTFGAKSSEVSFVKKNGINNWIESQLAPTNLDPAVEKSLKQSLLRISYGESADYPAINENRPFSSHNKTTEELWPLLEAHKMPYPERVRALEELRASRLIYAAHTQWQVRELMVDFWHNHFNIHAGDLAIAVAMPTFEREVIRKNCLGNFGQMLEGVATSTPMLIYLNNRSSRTGAPNENYARELFELHTLGKGRYLNEIYSKWRQVPGAEKGKPTGYIDQDVYEAARAFTGWILEDGRGTGNGINLPKTGKFHYLDSWHDPYQKRVLAQEFDPYGAPMADGKRVISILAGHPGTAEHLCEKLCRRFVSDTPPAALVSSCTKVWIDNQNHPQQIAKVLSHLFRSPLFVQAVQSGQSKKLKRPLELAMSFVRKLDLPHSPSMQLINEISDCGQRLYYWPTPDGHPDTTDFWLTTQTIRKRWFLPLGIMDNWWGTGFITPEVLSRGIEQPIEEVSMIKDIANRLLGDDAQVTLSQLTKNFKTPNKRLLGSGQDEWNAVRRTIALLAMSPSFQWK